MHKDGVCCLDLGTSHVKASVIHDRGNLCVFQEGDAPVCLPSARGSFTAEAYLAAVWPVVRSVVTDAQAQGWQIAGMTVTNQRATVIPVDPDGRILGPAISWQDVVPGRWVLEGIHNTFGCATRWASHLLGLGSRPCLTPHGGASRQLPVPLHRLSLTLTRMPCMPATGTASRWSGSFARCRGGNDDRTTPSVSHRR